MHPERLGPFTIGSILGSGGFGTVYRATHDDGRAVALKVLASYVDSGATLRRFEREGTIRIEHANVVRVIDAGQDQGLSYIAFELLEGAPLSVRLESAPLPPADVRDLGMQICAGLGAAHALGIVHRDLKPGNVFACQDGRIKILDFGIARPMSQAGPELTMAGAVIGTPGYLSPEQAKGDPEVTAAADLWALGLILYQALSGQNPFMRTNAVATILAVVLEEAPPLADALPRGLAEVVMRCLQKDPAQRWESAEALATGLAGVDLAASMVRPAPVELRASISADEQRVVAVLFASEVHDLPRLSAAVRELGGELIPVVGGAIGVFGGRTYEGDESARATHAALSARESASWVAVCTGRATGADGTISGDVVGAVERAVEARRPGVAVDAVTARALEGAFETRPTSTEGVLEVPLSLRGRRDSGSFSVLRQDLPLLGRERELAQLEGALDATLEGGRAGMVAVVGPPGIGKSRLRAELERSLRERGVRALTGRGESHQKDTAFHLMASVLRSEPTLESLLLNPGVAAERQRSALEALLVGTLGDRIWARQNVEPLSLLLGLLDEDGASAGRRDPRLTSDRVRVALADLIGAMVSERPLALVVDDAQWGDEASLRLLDELLTREAEHALLVFLATRPELEERHGGLFRGRAVTRLAPRGLGPEHVATVARAIAGRDVPEPIAREVASRTGGNPFFVEQIVRELVEQDLLDGELHALPIPVDVQGAVQSRLDHLPTDEKQLCKRAAVFASGFTEPALVALTQPDPARHLGALAKRGLVTARAARVEAAEREYHFGNALVAEVAYEMNSEGARRELHRLAAEFLATRPGADREELGRHFERAGLSSDARGAYAEAAARAARRGDSRSVLRCAERAMALGLEGSDAFELALARVDAHSFLGERDRQREVLEEALRYASKDTERARALTEKAAYLAAVDRHDEGVAVAVEAVAAARATDVPDILARALARRGWLLLYSGRVSEAGAAIGEAWALDALSPETRAMVAAWRAQLFSAMGDLGKRKAAYEEAIERFGDIGDLRRVAAAECNLADTLNRVGAYDEAEDALLDAVRVCRRVGNRVVEGYALANLGYALAGQARLDEAREAFDAARALADALGSPRLAVAVRLYQARTCFGDEPAAGAIEARAVAAEALELGLKGLAASAHAVASAAARVAGDPSGALVDAERAMALRDEVGAMEEDEAEIFLALAEALRATGALERAREIVARGASRLEFLAGRIADTGWRARFLVEVPVNRRLIELDGEGAGSR